MSATSQIAKITFLEFLKKYFGEIYIIALPVIAITLDTPRTRMQLVISCFFLSVVLIQFISGPLADKYGPRNVLLGLLPLFILGNLICFFTKDISTLYLGIMFAAFGIGTASTLGKGMLYKAAKGDTQKTSFFLVITSYVVIWAPAIGLMVGGNISHYFNWRMVFLLNLILGLAAIALTLTQKNIKPENKKPRLLNQYKKYGYYLKQLQILLPLLAIGILTSGIIVYYSMSTFYFYHTLKIPLNIIALFSFAIVFGNLIGKTISLKLIKALPLLVVLPLGIGVSFISALIMLTLSLMGLSNPASIIIPMMLYIIGLGTAMPAIRTYLFSQAAKEDAFTISSLTGISIALCTCILSFIVAHLHINSALPLATALTIFGLTAFIISSTALLIGKRK